MMYYDVEDKKLIKEEDFPKALVDRAKRYWDAPDMFEDFISGEYNTQYFTMVDYDELGVSSSMFFDAIVHNDEDERINITTKFYTACTMLAKEDFEEVDEDEVEFYK